MNVILSVLIFAGLFMVGMELPHPPDLAPVIGSVVPGSSAAKAGLQPGDLIRRANGEEIKSWHALGMTLITSQDRPLKLEVVRDGKSFDAVVTPASDARNQGGDLAGIRLPLRPQVTLLTPGGPAEAAGLKEHDVIVSVDGRSVLDREQFISVIEKNPGRRLVVEVERDGKALELVVTPRKEGTLGKIGAGIGFFQRYGPAKAFSASIAYNIQIVQDTVTIIGKIYTREVEAGKALAGPISIARESGLAVRQGFKYLVSLMGLLSISIAFMNLLPIPVLDGGQISILLVEEAIRRDLPLRVKEVVSLVGLYMILALMAVVLFFDIAKLF